MWEINHVIILSFVEAGIFVLGPSHWQHGAQVEQPRVECPHVDSERNCCACQTVLCLSCISDFIYLDITIPNSNSCISLKIVCIKFKYHMVEFKSLPSQYIYVRRMQLL